MLGDPDSAPITPVSDRLSYKKETPKGPDFSEPKDVFRKGYLFFKIDQRES